MKKIPKIIHKVWLGGAIPKELFEYHKQMEALHEDCLFMMWDMKSANKILGPSHLFEHSTYAGSSNMIRLHALYRFGGIYVDMDFKPIKRFDSNETIKNATAFVGRQPDGVLCNACFGASQFHPWIKAMIDNYGDQRVVDAAQGCHIMEPNLTEDVSILPCDVFYPYNWTEKNSPKPPTPDTIAIHLWNGSWIDEKRIH